MAAKHGLFVALNLLLFAAAVYGCADNCEPSYPTPPVEPPSSTYVPEPPAPIAPATDGHSHRPAGRCPLDALKLQVCASVLDGLVKISLPEEREKCCRLLDGLVDIDAAACLCTVLKTNLLGISLHVPIDISLSLNRCGRKDYPPGLTCPRY
ncbi:hypothetical protein SETIT_9G329600v2 [Setaria italica]|uniref:Bifunctional inhibitor/plant lipid transfer protein/seed storage helical domain-containing protein n=1 Tax=Setaria italica TaxID=4555 RepID=K4ALD4_SETIT|nr:cortical cell-delineating protein [Setaria italica]RCV43881.1 hypothetical protein SETIT_9G329600v2 [Setaria italica]